MNQRLIIASAIVCAACSSDPDIKPVPPTEMPPTETVAPGNTSGSRLRRINRLAADGAREFVGWYDSERDEDCSFVTIEPLLSPIRKCLPKTSGGSLYADPSCSMPIYPKLDSTDVGRAGNPLRQYVFNAWSTGTDDYVHMYVPGNRLYFDTPESEILFTPYRMGPEDPCEMRGPVLTVAAFVFLEEISIDEFVSWNEAVDQD